MYISFSLLPALIDRGIPVPSVTHTGLAHKEGKTKVFAACNFKLVRVSEANVILSALAQPTVLG